MLGDSGPGSADVRGRSGESTTIEWSPRFSVGVPVLDDQHRTILRLTNRLVEIAVSPADSEVISDVLTEMTLYTKEHFETEEQYMRAAGFAELEAHAAEHLDFIERTAELSQAAVAGDQTVGCELVCFIARWWQHHILESDQRYRDCVTAMR